MDSIDCIESFQIGMKQNRKHGDDLRCKIPKRNSRKKRKPGSVVECQKNRKKSKPGSVGQKTAMAARGDRVSENSADPEADANVSQPTRRIGEKIYNF